MRTLAMDIERREHRIFICVIVLASIFLTCLAIHTAERVGYLRGYNAAVAEIID